MVARRAGSEPRSGSVSRKAEMWSRATSGSHFCFCSSEPKPMSGSATPIAWWGGGRGARGGGRARAEGLVGEDNVPEQGVPRAGKAERGFVVALREPEPAVLLGHLHAQ